MGKRNFRYIYGPVSSWRLGRSLGIDLISRRGKQCTFDCVYCQLGRAKAGAVKRRIYVPTQAVIKELRLVPHAGIDYITFSGSGEPALARNLGRVIQTVKKIRREPVAVLTNASLISRADVRRELSRADFVIAKMDADSQSLLEKVNHPARTIRFASILRGLKKFRGEFRGRLGIQIMFTRENEPQARGIAAAIAPLCPDEVQINTPRRPCGCAPLSARRIRRLKNFFRAFRVIGVFDKRRKKDAPFDARRTARRRGGPRAAVITKEKRIMRKPAGGRGR